MLGYAPAAERSEEIMRVLRTQIGFVSTWVAAPARPEETKKSAGVRADVPGAEPEPGPSLKVAMARSIRDLKKKKEAQLLALPTRLGVRPR